MSDEPTDLRDVQPSSWRHVIGQRHVTRALEIAVAASFAEKKRMDELCLIGPPGLGKSALVSVLANELAVPMTEILAQSITNTAELNSVLLSATEGILFLDEIHLLSAVNQQCLVASAGQAGESSSAVASLCSRSRWLRSRWSVLPHGFRRRHRAFGGPFPHGLASGLLQPGRTCPNRATAVPGLGVGLQAGTAGRNRQTWPEGRRGSPFVCLQSSPDVSRLPRAATS